MVELDKVANELITDAEFARVRRQLMAATAFGTDTVTWRAYRCGEVLSTGAAASIADWYDKLAAVTREQIRDAAKATFHERSRNVGWFAPEIAD
jgi:predicted Zn-dependent peptidase